MRIKTLFIALILPFAAGLVPAPAAAAPAPAPVAPMGDAALVAGTGSAHQAPVVVVRRGRGGRYYNRGYYGGRRGYYGGRTRVVRRVYYRNGRRFVEVRRIRY